MLHVGLGNREEWLVPERRPLWPLVAAPHAMELNQPEAPKAVEGVFHFYAVSFPLVYNLVLPLRVRRCAPGRPLPLYLVAQLPFPILGVQPVGIQIRPADYVQGLIL